MLNAKSDSYALRETTLERFHIESLSELRERETNKRRDAVWVSFFPFSHELFKESSSANLVAQLWLGSLTCAPNWRQPLRWEIQRAVIMLNWVLSSMSRVYWGSRGLAGSLKRNADFQLSFLSWLTIKASRKSGRKLSCERFLFI